MSVSAGNTPVWLKLARAYARASNPVESIARRFIRELGMRGSLIRGNEGGLCIDIGAGSAPYRSAIEKCWCVRQYVAFDIAASDMTDVTGDAMRMPFREGCAQFMTSFDVLQHIPDSKGAISEAVRVLAPGGFLILTFPFNYCECDVLDFRRWTLSGMERDLRELGLEVVRIEQRGGRFFAFACALNWAVQHLVRGQRKGWRTPRTSIGILRAISLHILSVPTTLVQWVTLWLDRLFPNEGCYMGGIAIAIKPTPNPTPPNKLE